MVVSDWKGKAIIIEAKKGDKGFTGCYAMDDTYKGKTTRKIKVTPTAEVSFADEVPAAAALPQKPAPTPTQAVQKPAAPAPATTHAAPAKPAQKNAGPADPVAAKAYAVAMAIQIANLQLLCLNTVNSYVAVRYEDTTGVKMPAEERHAWAMNLMIQMERENMHMQMPTHRIKTPPPEKPAPPPQAPYEPADQDGYGPDDVQPNDIAF